MPAPRRAILADITDLKLDPKVPYTKTSSGRLLSNKVVKESVQPVFASVQKQDNLSSKIDKAEKKEVELEAEIKKDLIEDKVEEKLEVVTSSHQEVEMAVEKEAVEEDKVEKTIKQPSKKKKVV